MSQTAYASDAKIAETLAVLGSTRIAMTEQMLLRQMLVGVANNQTPSGSAPVNLTPPSVSGILGESETLTLTEGTWTESPTLTHQWQLSAAPPSWSDIPGETGNTYVIQSGDVGQYIRVLETATNAFGEASEGSVPQLVPDLTPQNLQVTNADRQIQLTWDADANLEYLIYINTVDVFGTAAFVSSVAAASTGTNYNTTDNLDPVPFAGTLTTGSKYYFWVVGGDGANNPVTDPSNSAAGRAFVTLENSVSANLWVPDGATLNLVDLLFGTTPLPDFVNVLYGVFNYFIFEGAWYDANDESPADSVPISGAFTVQNNSGVSITFWDAEP